MRLVLDACLPPWLVDSLMPVVAPACTVEHVTRLYGQGCKDADWIARLSAEGGAVFLTLDRHMRTRPLEVQALIASRCVGIVLTPQWQSDPDHVMLARLLLHWEHIVTASHLPPPAMLELAFALRPRAPGQWRGWDKIRGRLRPPAPVPASAPR